MRRKVRLEARVGQVSSRHHTQVLVLEQVDRRLVCFEGKCYIEQGPSIHTFLDIFPILQVKILILIYHEAHVLLSILFKNVAYGYIVVRVQVVEDLIEHPVALLSVEDLLSHEFDVFSFLFVKIVAFLGDFGDQVVTFLATHYIGDIGVGWCASSRVHGSGTTSGLKCGRSLFSRSAGLPCDRSSHLVRLYSIVC